MRVSAVLFALGLSWQSASLAIDIPLERLTASPDLSGPAVREVLISPDGEHVAYLRSGDDDRLRQDLWIFDYGTQRTRRLIDSRPLGADQVVSAEEAARRERQRTAGSRGIGHFQWSPDSTKLLFGVGDALYLATLQGDADPALRVIARGSDIIDPRLSPKGRYVAFIRAQNLSVMNVETGATRQLTQDGKDTVHNAESEFVAQEEMAQPRGYWWSPDETMIAFKRFDEATVPIQRRFEIQADTTNVVEQRYPLAGGPNVAVKLGVVSVEDGGTRWIALGDDPQPYIPRVDWLPDSRAVSYQKISRDQKTLELFRVEISDLKQTVLVTDHSKTWLDLHDDLRFLEHQQAFVWASDQHDRKHLELVGLDGKRRHPLTSGEMQIDELLAVDEAGGYVYFAGDIASALERHVWRVKLDGSDAGHPTKISGGAGWHVASFPDGHGAPKLWVDRYNDPSQPTQVSVVDAAGKRLAWIEENKLDDKHPYHAYLDRHVVPEFGMIPADDGTLLNYSIMRPPGFDPTRRYPVFHYVYGGPHAQNVQRHWGRPLYEVLAQHGYIVFMLDNRGSSRRGRKFSDAIYHRLGDVEVRDQLAGLAWLDKQPGVDRDRIGVMGWSYGGYMSLMLLAKAPQGRYAAGISVAPVTRFELYDTFYTERYLGTPAENPDGYRETSVFTALPNLKPPLLLVHGMADDNVLFTNSTSLMAAMQAQGKQFRLMTYPGGKHGLSTRAMTDHVDRLIVEYFDEMVKNRGVATKP
jgi:dipeptidyl-peptidase-4